jgi:hypothetical protein
MKRKFFQITLILGICAVMTSCYTVTATIGSGSQTGEKTVGHNHFLIGGLIPVATADVKKMAGDAKDYQLTVQHSFVDGLLMVITGGLYTPTTTIVKK